MVEDPSGNGRPAAAPGERSPALRQALGALAPESTTTPATLASLAETYCRKLGAGLCVDHRSARPMAGVAATYPRDRVSRTALATLIDGARVGRSVARHPFAFSDGPALVVAEPARSGADVIGTLAAGYRFDDAMSAEIAKVTRGDVAFVCSDRVVCGSNMSVGGRAALTARFENGTDVPEPEASKPLTLAGTPFMWAVHPLAGDAARFAEAADKTGGQPRTARGRRRAGTPGAARGLVVGRTGVQPDSDGAGWVGVWTVGVAIGGTILLSRRLTRPLRDLASAAHEIAGGNWARRVPVGGPVEARTMAESFNHMTVTLSHWHEEATSQAARLRESNERFRAVTDSAHDAIISVNGRGEIVFWNLRAQAVFGYDERQASGRPAHAADLRARPHQIRGADRPAVDG